MIKMLREFSTAGPCIVLGEVVATTPKSVRYIDDSFKVRRRGGRDWGHGLLHTEPCRRCCDHPSTSYPNGYMD